MERYDSKKEAEFTLNSLDRLKRVKAPEGFIEDLTRKIIFREEKLWINRAKFALAAMIVFALINLSVLITADQTGERESLIESLATEWDLPTSDY